MFCFPLFMCSLWEIHDILEESTKQYSKVSQKGYGACGQTCYTAQQAGSRIMVLNILHMIKNLKALFRETGHFLSHTPDLRLMTHPEPVGTQSDCDSRGSIFILFHTHHSPGPFGASKSVLSPSWWEQIPCFHSTEYTGQTGHPAGLLCYTAVAHVTGMVTTLYSLYSR